MALICCSAWPRTSCLPPRRARCGKNLTRPLLSRFLHKIARFANDKQNRSSCGRHYRPPIHSNSDFMLKLDSRNKHSKNQRSTLHHDFDENSLSNVMNMTTFILTPRPTTTRFSRRRLPHPPSESVKSSFQRSAQHRTQVMLTVPRACPSRPRPRTSVPAAFARH